MSFESGRKSFTTLMFEVTVRYRFLSQDVEVPEGVFEGTTNAMTGDGLLLVGRIPPHSRLHADLLSGEAVVGVLIDLPEEPVRALARVGWLEAGAGAGRVGLGLFFEEIQGSDRSRLQSFIEKKQARGG